MISDTLIVSTSKLSRLLGIDHYRVVPLMDAIGVKPVLSGRKVFWSMPEIKERLKNRQSDSLIDPERKRARRVRV